MSKQYDLIVIGAGSGLKVAAGAKEKYGFKVAVVEEGPMGGTCLNRGCIPSKIVIHAADLAEEIKRAHLFGIDAEYKGVDFEKVTNRANEFVDASAKGIEEGLRNDPDTDLYKARAEFIDSKTIKVGDETIAAENILIAAGTRPFIPPVPGLEDVGYMTSTETLRLTKQPKKVAVIGGGYISTELGHFLGALGTEVTIVERGGLLLKREDGDVARMFTKVFSEKHNVLLNHDVVHAEKEGDMKVLVVKDKQGKETRVEADEILVTTGRTSNTDLLKIENTDIAVDKRGYVSVNEYMETNVPGVWALGDIVGKAPFKHGANYEAQFVLANLSGESKRAIDYTIMPHAVFSSPQIAGVGLTEEEAKEKGLSFRIAKKEYKQTGMGKALEEQNGFSKFIIEEGSEMILGCHIIGPHASVLIHEVIIAMTSGDGTVGSIKNAIHIHPSLSEVVGWAL